MTVHHMYRPLNEAQRLAIAKLLGRVFVMLRAPGYNYFWTPKRRADEDMAGTRYAFERSIAVGEAFHNIPLHMEEADFWFSAHKTNIKHYVSRFPEFAEFIERLEEIERLE